MQCLFCGHHTMDGSSQCGQCQKPLPVFAAPEGYLFDKDKGLYYESVLLPPEEGGFEHIIWFDPVSGEYTQTQRSADQGGTLTGYENDDPYITQDLLNSSISAESVFTPDSLLFDEYKSEHAPKEDDPEARRHSPAPKTDKPDNDNVGGDDGENGLKKTLKDVVLPIALGVSIPLLLLILLVVGHFGGLYRLPFLPSFDKPEASPSPQISPFPTAPSDETDPTDSPGLWGDATQTPDAATTQAPSQTPDTTPDDDPDATPEPTPESTPDATPEPTPSPTPQPTPEPIKTPEPVPTSFPVENPDPDDPNSVPIEWKDKSLEAAFRARLAIAADPIWPMDLESVKSISIEGTAITIDTWHGTLSAKPASFGDLALCKNLTDLSITKGGLSGLSALPHIGSVQNLTLSGNALSSIQGLSAYTGLRSLDLRDNQITSIAALSSMKSLKILHLDNNQLKTITEITQMTALQILTLDDNPIEDYSPAADFGYENPVTIPSMNKALLEDIILSLDSVFTMQLVDFHFPTVNLHDRDGYYIAELDGYGGALVAYHKDESIVNPEDKYAVYIELKAAQFFESGAAITPEALQKAFTNLTESGTGKDYRATAVMAGRTITFLPAGENQYMIRVT